MKGVRYVAKPFGLLNVVSRNPGATADARTGKNKFIKNRYKIQRFTLTMAKYLL
jgi:hypothetical protein